jgi:hypothetical protein
MTKEQMLALQTTIERLERDLVAADIRIENDALEIAGLTREQVGLALDAARYRWLRTSRHDEATVMTYEQSLNDWIPWSDGDDVDISVDAAMKGEAK